MRCQFESRSVCIRNGSEPVPDWQRRRKRKESRGAEKHVGVSLLYKTSFAPAFLMCVPTETGPVALMLKGRLEPQRNPFFIHLHAWNRLLVSCNREVPPFLCSKTDGARQVRRRPILIVFMREAACHQRGPHALTVLRILLRSAKSSSRLDVSPFQCSIVHFRFFAY